MNLQPEPKFPYPKRLSDTYLCAEDRPQFLFHYGGVDIYCGALFITRTFWAAAGKDTCWDFLRIYSDGSMDAPGGTDNELVDFLRSYIKLLQ